MKKIIILGIVSLFLFTSFNANINAIEQNNNNKITKSYSFKTPVLSKTTINNTMYDTLIIDDTPCDGNPGEPMLPGRGSYILLPPNSQVSNIVVNPGKMISLGSDYLIEPAGEDAPLSNTEEMKIPTPNQEIYSSTNLFPASLYTKIGTYNCRGYTILVLKLNPVQYIPASGELFYYPDLTVNVETVAEIKDNSLFRGLQEDDNDIGMKVDNPTMSTIYTQTLGSAPAYLTYDLLIITSEALKSGFEPLALAHNSTGIRTFIKTVEDIYNESPGVDNAEKIRNYIKYSYNTYGIEYVLLGGDNEIVPARYFSPYCKSTWPIRILFPSDLYYGCLDGKWNSPEEPNPSNKDISIDDLDVNIQSGGKLKDPVPDYDNYVVGDSSMCFNCKSASGLDTGYINITFGTPRNFRNFNWFNFKVNYSRNDLVNYPLSGEFGDNIVFVDNLGHNLTLNLYYSLNEGGIWVTYHHYPWFKRITFDSELFNIKKVKEIKFKFYLNSPTVNDFIRLDGIYLSKFSDDYYGEKGEEDDLYAEVYVGRACVDTLSDAANFTNKTIAYINTDENENYLKNVTMAGEFAGGNKKLKGNWGGNSLDDLIGKCHNYLYTTQGFPENKFEIVKLYDRDWKEKGWREPENDGTGGWPKELIIDQINNRTVHIINHVGHGNTYRVMKLNEPAYWEGESEIGEECHDVEKLTNNKYFFIYSHACYAGAFDNEMIVYNLPYDCIGEYLTVKTEHGAFACILNSCFGYYNIFTTDGASQRYNREFWDAVFDENITIISRANQDSKEDNIWRINGGNGIMRIVYYELNLLGDPSVQFKYLDDSLVNSQSSPQSQPQTQPNSEPSTQPSSQPSEQLCDTTQQSTTGSTTTSK